MTFPDGDSYVGDWDSGNMNGWGAFYWNNGNSYQVRQFSRLELYGGPMDLAVADVSFLMP